MKMQNEITEIKFYPIKPSEKGLIGFASCIFANLSLNCIAVYTTLDGGIRLVFPERILPNGKKLGVFYPIDQASYSFLKNAIEKKIQDLFKKAANTCPNKNVDIAPL